MGAFWDGLGSLLAPGSGQQVLPNYGVDQSAPINRMCGAVGSRSKSRSKAGSKAGPWANTVGIEIQKTMRNTHKQYIYIYIYIYTFIKLYI